MERSTGGGGTRVRGREGDGSFRKENMTISTTGKETVSPRATRILAVFSSKEVFSPGWALSDTSTEDDISVYVF